MNPLSEPSMNYDNPKLWSIQFDFDLQMLIHSATQLSEEGDVPVNAFHRRYPSKHRLNVVGDVLVNHSLLIVLSVMLHLTLIQHAIQSHRFLTVLQSGVHLREPIVIAVDSPLVKYLGEHSL